jgi:hypothetical protein
MFIVWSRRAVFASRLVMTTFASRAELKSGRSVLQDSSHGKILAPATSSRGTSVSLQRPQQVNSDRSSAQSIGAEAERPADSTTAPERSTGTEAVNGRNEQSGAPCSPSSIAQICGTSLLLQLILVRQNMHISTAWCTIVLNALCKAAC